MPPPPSPLHIFHITAIPNLPGVAACGALWSNGKLASQARVPVSIAYQGAQGRRASKAVPMSAGGVLHDYVPFYFAPRSPMLFTINNGNVSGCPYRQEDIVHAVTTVEAVTAAGLPSVFYDYNATLDIATCYDDPADLARIDWPIFFENPTVGGYCKYWHSIIAKQRYVLRMETRQAEFLVHDSVPLTVLLGIGTYNEAKAVQVRSILNAAGVGLAVKAKPEWYF